MKIKRMLVLAGVMSLFGLLWAAPVSADGHLPTMTVDPASVPAEAGDVTLTVSGVNWSDPLPTPFFITACPGAAGDPTPVLSLSTAADAMALCPNLMASALEIEGSGGSFSTEWTVTITQGDIDAGALVILAGWLSADTLAAPEEHATVAILGIGAAEEPAAEEPMDDAGDEDMAADEEPMDDSAAEEEMPVTGHESGLLVVVGVGVLIAGLLVVGTGRRVRSATR